MATSPGARSSKAVPTPQHLSGRHGLDQLPPTQFHHRREALWIPVRRLPSPNSLLPSPFAAACGASPNEYDFGDSWTHEVVVEDVAWPPYVLKHGVCLDDVGGTGGYEEFLSAIADPLHEEHDSYLVWVGCISSTPPCSTWPPANAALQRVR
jgi:hypothetical protein